MTEGGAHHDRRGIVLYDFLFCRGGAERVALELARGLPNADLCFGFRDRKHFPDPALEGLRYFDLGVSIRFPGGKTLAGLRSYKNKTAFIRAYDWVIYSGYIAPEAVYSHPQGLNVYYCHTVPRFAFDLYRDRVAGAGWWKRPFFVAMAKHVRRRYAEAINHMDRVICNSDNVRRRLLKHLNVQSVVIHPPCDVTGYQWLGQGEYYLSTARLEPYKRVDLIVKAFRSMPDKNLIVTSGGTDKPRLMRLADGAPNISFTDWVSDARCRELTGHAIATLYLPVDEDFGISPVESMAAGKPVIGVAEGGMLETVVDQRTGYLLKTEPKEEDIVKAVGKLTKERAKAMQIQCMERSRLFTRERFLEQMHAVLGDGPNKEVKA